MESFERILILRGGAIGDFVLTLPAIGAIRQAFPSAHIRLLGHPHITDLAVGRGYADSAWRLDDPEFACLFAPAQGHAQTSLSVAPGQDVGEGLRSLPIRSTHDLRGREQCPAPTDEERAQTSLGVTHTSGQLDELKTFDLIVAFLPDPEGVLAGNLGRLCAGKVIVRDPVPPVEPKCHAVDHLCGVLAEIGVAGEKGSGAFYAQHPKGSSSKMLLTPFPELFPTGDDLAQADAFLAEKDLDPARTIAIHPGSGGTTKNWSAERFSEIIERIKSETDCQVLLTGGPADEEAMAEIGGGLATAENLPLPILAAILSRCRATLGNDSGITHIASAVGTPTLAIFGPTDPDVWGPRGDNVTLIRGRASCAPCSREERMACPDRKCLALVSIDEVWKRMGEVIIEQLS